MKGAKSPLCVQSTRIFKLFTKFKNPHSVAKRLFRHAEGFSAARKIPLGAWYSVFLCGRGRGSFFADLRPGNRLRRQLFRNASMTSERRGMEGTAPGRVTAMDEALALMRRVSGMDMPSERPARK